MIMKLQIMRFTARKKMVLRRLWKLIGIIQKGMKGKSQKFMLTISQKFLKMVVLKKENM